MSYMSVDLNSLKDIEKKVSSLSKSLEKIKSSLSSTRNNIDSVVRNRSGIDSSISSLIREVGERELIMANVKRDDKGIPILNGKLSYNPPKN